MGGFFNFWKSKPVKPKERSSNNIVNTASCGASCLPFWGIGRRTINPEVNFFALSYSVEEIQQYLTERELQAAPGGHQKYAQAIFETIQASQRLGQKSWDDITTIVDKFNDLFAATYLPSIPNNVPDQKISGNDCTLNSLDNPIIWKLKHELNNCLLWKNGEGNERRHLKSASKSQSVVDFTANNILTAFHDVYIQMNQNRGEFNLIYHTLRHANEVAVDIHQLFSSPQFKQHQAMHLLMLLCGLYHDAVFSRKRIDDETASADALIQFLEPILNQLDEDEKQVMCDLFRCIIVGGSTPTFFKKNKNKEPLLVVESVSEVVKNLFVQKEDGTIYQESYIKMDELTEVLSNVDFLRTSIQELHQGKEAYDSPAWQQLAPFYTGVNPNCPRITLQLRFTQAFRMINEIIAGFDTSYNLTRLTARSQEPNRPDTPPDISEVDIQRLAKAIKYVAEHDPDFAEKGAPDDSFKEVKFAQRMFNSYNPERVRRYTLTNTWSEHIKVLDALYDFLMSNEVLLEDKQKVVVAVARVAAEQDGRTHSVEKIVQVANQLSTINKVQRESKNSDADNHEGKKKQKVRSIHVQPLQTERIKQDNSSSYKQDSTRMPSTRNYNF